MSENMNILCINALAYIGLLIYYWKRLKSINLGIIVLAIYVVSSIGSVWYYTYDLAKIYYPNIYAIPLVYVFFLVWLSTKALLDFDIKEIKGIDDSGIQSFLVGLAAFLSFFSILPFLELLIKASSMSMGGSFFGQMYEAEGDRALYLFSPVGKICFALIRHTGPLPVLLLFYVFVKKENKLLLVGCFISVITLVFYEFMAGSRGGVIGWVCAIVFTLIIFRQSMPEKTYSLIKKCLVIGFVGVVFVFFTISFSRIGYSDSNKYFEPDRWFAQYLGMGYIRFSNEIWSLEKLADGNQNFGLIKSWFGDFDYKSRENYISLMSDYLGIPLTEFYTYIGDIYMDFGRIGTILFFILFFCLCKFVVLRNNKRLSILQFILIFYIFRFLCYGFASNLSRSPSVQKEMVYPIILGIILSIMQLTMKRTK